MIGRLLNDDIFISYARADASAYADALAGALQQRGFSVFIDRLGTEANAQIPASLMAKLRGAAMLVLVGSPAAAASGFVGDEVRTFASERGSDRVLPIDVGGALARASWFDAVVGIAPEPELSAVLEAGEPSPRVVARVGSAFRYTRAKQRLRRSVLAALVVLAALLITSVVAAFQARDNLLRARHAGVEAQQAQTAASAAQQRAANFDAAARQAAAAASEAAARAETLQRVALSRQLGALALERVDTALDAAALWAERALAADKTAEAERALVVALTREPRLVTHLHGRQVVALGAESLVTVRARGSGGDVHWTNLRNPWAPAARLRLPAGTQARTADDRYVVLGPLFDEADGELAHRLVVLSRDGREHWELRSPVPTMGGSFLSLAGPVLLAGVSNDGSNYGLLARWELLPAGRSTLTVQRWPIERGWLEALSPDGRTAVVIGDDELAAVDAVTGERRRIAPFRSVQMLAGEAQSRFLQSGRWFAIEQQPGSSIETQLWDVQSATPALPPRAAGLVAASPGGTRLALRRSDGAVQVYSTTQTRPVGPPLRPKAGSRWDDSQMSIDGRWMVVPMGDRDGTLQLFDLDREQALGTPQPPVQQEQALTWEPDGRLAVVPGPVPGLRFVGDRQLWQPTARGSAAVTLSNGPENVEAAAGDASGVYAWLTGARPRFRIVDLATGQRRDVPAPNLVRALALSPDGASIAVVAEGEVTLRDRSNLAVVRWRRPVTDTARSAAFSPDGRWLAIGYDTGRVELKAAADGRPSQGLFEHPTPQPDPTTTELDANSGLAIVRLLWRSDGSRLASIGWYGDVWAWNVEPEDWARAACRLAGRELAGPEIALATRGISLPPSRCVFTTRAPPLP